MRPSYESRFCSSVLGKWWCGFCLHFSHDRKDVIGALSHMSRRLLFRPPRKAAGRGLLFSIHSGRVSGECVQHRISSSVQYFLALFHCDSHPRLLCVGIPKLWTPDDVSYVVRRCSFFTYLVVPVGVVCSLSAARQLVLTAFAFILKMLD